MAMKKRELPKSKLPKSKKMTKGASKSWGVYELATGKPIETSSTKKNRGRPKGSKVVHIAKSPSVAAEIGLLQRIDKKVTRIDQTVNSGFHLAKKAKKSAHRNALSKEFKDAYRSGELYE